MSKANLVWSVIGAAGLVLFLLGFFGAFDVSECGAPLPPPSHGGIGLCIVDYAYDFLAILVGILMIIMSIIGLVRRRSSTENRQEHSSSTILKPHEISLF